MCAATSTGCDRSCGRGYRPRRGPPATYRAARGGLPRPACELGAERANTIAATEWCRAAFRRPAADSTSGIACRMPVVVLPARTEGIARHRGVLTTTDR